MSLLESIDANYQTISGLFFLTPHGQWQALELNMMSPDVVATSVIHQIQRGDRFTTRQINHADYIFHTLCEGDDYLCWVLKTSQPVTEAMSLCLTLAAQVLHHDFAMMVKSASLKQNDAFTNTAEFIDNLLDTKQIAYQVANRSPSMIWVKDIDGQYTFANDLALKRWGLAEPEVLGKTSYDLFGPDVGERHFQSDNYVLQTGKDYEYSHDGLTGFASHAHMSEQFKTVKYPLYDKDNHIIGVCGMCFNVTQVHEAQNKLSLISSIFNKSHEGMIITDPQSNIINVNQAFTDITGFKEEDVIGKKPNVLSSGYHQQDFYHELWQSLKEHGQWQGEFINRRKDGALYPQQASINAVYDNDNQITSYFAVFTDISERKAQQDKLYRLAFYDKLTQLPNRTYLIKTINDQIHQHEVKDQSTFAVISLDIDQFKQLRESLGYHYSDTVLQRVARRLNEHMRHNDFIAHISGDEFCIVVNDITCEQDVQAVIERIMGTFERPFSITDVLNPVHLSVSLGISIFNQDGQESEILIRNANTALYEAKSHGMGKFAFYKAELTTRARNRLQIHSALRIAIERNELSLAYQPQFDLETNELSGFEALLRWHNDELGFVSPADFIPVAEQTGLMRMIGTWVLKTACQQAKEWLDQGLSFGRIAVNVSAIQFQDSNFVDQLLYILAQTQLPASALAIEITEGVLLEDSDQVIEQLNLIRAHGIEIALDDFGTGYSSLSYLKGLPIHKLKIDRSFIIDVPHNMESNNIVKAIVVMANSMKLDVVVEGLEEIEQVDQLKDFGCQYGQGFYLARPMPAHEAIKFCQPASVA
ncbi:MAG: sensor domain-containing protein [Vibrio sp.]